MCSIRFILGKDEKTIFKILIRINDTMAKISHFIGIGVYLFEFFVGSFNHLIKVDNFKFLELSGVGILNEFVNFP